VGFLLAKRVLNDSLAYFIISSFQTRVVLSASKLVHSFIIGGGWNDSTLNALHRYCRQDVRSYYTLFLWRSMSPCRCWNWDIAGQFGKGDNDSLLKGGGIGSGISNARKQQDAILCYNTPSLHHLSTPAPQHSSTPTPQHPNTSSLHHILTSSQKKTLDSRLATGKLTTSVENGVKAG